MIAALFVETDGTYYGIPDVDPWDVKRDARKYAGPHPVVAHPPCQLWVNMAGVNFIRYRDRPNNVRNRPGNDLGCFAAALEAVRNYGGVLEHPAGSFAWDTFGLPRPPETGWRLNSRELRGTIYEWTCEVWQTAYGHKARKRTWLYYVGENPPPEMDWRREAGTHQVGWFDRNKPTLGKRAASATPPAFRDALLDLARHSRLT